MTTRREFLQRASLAAGGAALIGAWLDGADSAGSVPPNLVFVLIDDLGYGDIGPFGSALNRTPSLDRMAAEGMTLTSFCAAPVCTPSRAQVMTGCYAKRMSLPNVLGPVAATGISPDERTLADLLKARGYATACIGKWHLGDQPEFLPTRHGFDRYFGIPYSNDMGPRDGAAARAQRPPLPLLRDGQVIEALRPADQDRLTARYTEEAEGFIRDHRSTPFFLYLAHTAVHVPIHPGEAFRGKSANGAYGDWVEEVDWSVGRVLAVLRELGLSERTLVMFSSDNGPWLTQGANGGTAGPLRGGKGGTYEGGVRVPTLAWWPGRVPAGRVSAALCGNIDVLPTFVALAGGAVPAARPIDGRDLTPLLLGRTDESPREAHYYFAGNALQAVRSGPWKLAIARQNEATGKPSPEAGQPFTPTLYNLDDDLGERHDVAAVHPDVVQRLQALVATMDADLGVSGLGPGVRPPGRAERPVGLYLPGQAPAAAGPVAIDRLKPGDAIASEEAPQVGGKPFAVACEIGPAAPDGIVVAHGGTSAGYAVYLRDGRPVFAVRIGGKVTAVVGPAALPTGRCRLEARLARDGGMSLAVDGTRVAEGRAPGLIPTQPAEDFCVGHDNAKPLADYGPAGLYRGTLAGLRVSVE